MNQVPIRIVTTADFQRLRIGMTHGQLLEILGNPGEEVHRGKIDGIATIWYQWENLDGSGISAIIRDDLLVMKTQFLLT